MHGATPSAGIPAASPAPARGKGSPVDAFARSLASEYLVEKKEQREAAARANRPARPWRRIFSIAAIVICGAVWLVPSLGTRPAPKASAQRVDASARLTLALAAQRVRDYQARHGRLPSTLTQSGVSDQRIDYRLTGKDAFMLTLTHEGRTWDLPSTSVDSAYVRDALSRLGIVPKPK